MPAPVLPRALLAVLSCASLASAQWTLEVSSDGSDPTARHEAAAVAFDGDFYLLGGRGSRPVDRYDPVAQVWTDLGTPPQQIHHVQPVVHDDLVWIVSAFEGGYPNETAVSSVWTYDPALNTWTEGPAIPSARNRGAAGVVVYDDAFYVVGGNTMGHNGGAVPWLDRYDPLTDTWTALADAPHARDHFTAVVVGHKLVVAGGRQTEQPNPFVNTVAAVDIYDFTTGSWTNAPLPIPTERAGTMAVAHGEFAVVIGGESDSGAHAATEALDVTTGEWTLLPDLLDSRHSGGAVCDGSDVYVMSGSGNKGGSPELDTTERLDLTGLLPTSASNLLTNGDLDAGLGGWTDDGDLSLAADGAIASPALDIANGSASQLLAVDAETTYTLSGSYQVFGTAGAVDVVLEPFDVTATSLGAVTTALPPGTTDFTSFAVDMTMPRHTVEVDVAFVVGGDRTLRLDDLVLRETPAEVAVLGVPANPWVLEPSSTGPVLGALYDPSIDHGDFAPAATLDVFILGFFPINVVAGPGTLLVDPGVAFLLFVAPGTPLNLPLPMDTSLVGLPLLLQGASIEPGKKSFTNALEITVQA